MKVPREICHCVVGLQCPCSQRVSKAILNVLNVIETQRACWSLHTLDTPSFELVVGHVSAVRPRLATNNDEAVAVVTAKGHYWFEYLVNAALRVKVPSITTSCVRHLSVSSGDVNQRYQDCCIKQFQQLYRDSIMVWGSISKM